MEQTLPKMLKKTAGYFPEVAAQMTKDSSGTFQPILYRELLDASLDVGAAFLANGVTRGDLIGLISDNRKEWQQTSMGIM